MNHLLFRKFIVIVIVIDVDIIIVVFHFLASSSLNTSIYVIIFGRNTIILEMMFFTTITAILD